MPESELPHQELDPEAGLSTWERILPAVTWIRSYRGSQIVSDVIAGGVLSVLLLPQALAYALLAELPPQVGLFAAIAPAIGYAAFGSSRFIAVGPVALVALLTGEAIASQTRDGLPATEVALLLAAMVGGLLAIGGWAGLSRAGDFVSRPVLDGFATAVAVLIASSQLRHVLGADVERASGFLDRLTDLFGASVHGPTIAVGAICLALFVGLPKPTSLLLEKAGVPIAWRAPVVRALPFVVLVGTMVATSQLALAERGVAVVGAIEVSRPPLTVPALRSGLIVDLLPSAFTLALVIFVVGLAIARTLAEKGADIDPKKEMVALGVANLGSSFTGGMPVGASVSRSSVARDAGAKTPMAIPIAGLLALLAGILAGPLLAVLPRAAMAALILSAIFGLVDPAQIRRTWRIDKGDGAVLALTFIAVLLMGVELGLGLGIGASLLLHLWLTSRPEVVVEGPSEEGEGIRGARRSDVGEAFRTPVLVLRIDQQLYFGNSRWVRQRVIEEVLHDTSEDGPRCVLFDLCSVDDVDSTALDMFEELFSDLDEVGLGYYLAEAKKPVKSKLSAGMPDVLSDDNWFIGLEGALEVLQERYGSAGSAETSPED